MGSLTGLAVFPDSKQMNETPNMTASDILLGMLGKMVFWFTRNRNTTRRGWKKQEMCDFKQ